MPEIINYFIFLWKSGWTERGIALGAYAGGCSGNGVAAKDADEDLEDGELLDDGEADEEEEKSEIVDPPAPAAIPSLLDMEISPPRNGKTFSTHNTVSLM